VPFARDAPLIRGKIVSANRHRSRAALERRRHEACMSVEPLAPKAWIEMRMAGVAGLGLLVSASCVRSNRDREPGVEIKCLSAETRQTSAVLPDSHWLRIEGNTFEKVSSTGQLSWTTTLPATDALLQGFSVAPNATVYMRDKQRLLALGSEGAWLWERPEPIQGLADASYQPVAMSDSGVIVRSGRQQYRAYSHTGTLRWSVDVDLKGGPSEKPLVLPNGFIIVQGDSDSACLSPTDGKVEWRQSKS
jgi:outer membrane protein assembly factor BamB